MPTPTEPAQAPDEVMTLRQRNRVNEAALAHGITDADDLELLHQLSTGRNTDDDYPERLAARLAHRGAT